MKIKIRRKVNPAEKDQLASSPAGKIEKVDGKALQFFLLLDAAKMRERIEEAKRFNPEHECLYKGEAADTLHSVGPWLFSFPTPSLFSDWYIANFEKQNWGIIIQSNSDFKSLYIHLKKFLLVKTEEGKKLYFRYYDPRVLPTFLETADESQLETFFGPIDKFIVENENTELQEYKIVQNKLISKKSNLFFTEEV